MIFCKKIHTLLHGITSKGRALLRLVTFFAVATVNGEEQSEVVPIDSSPSTNTVSQTEESHFSIPEWLYSYNLGIMRLGFYNTKPGGLLEIGLYNNAFSNHHPHDFFILPDTLFQLGVVNGGNNLTSFRVGIVNLHGNVSHSGIDLGIYNHNTWGWQIGLLGSAQSRNLQTNLINYGANGHEGIQIGALNISQKARHDSPQLGLINIAPGSSEGQCGLLNIAYSKSANSDTTQIGLINIGIYKSDYQFGLINISTKWTRSFGLLNFRNRFPFVTPIFGPWNIRSIDQWF